MSNSEVIKRKTVKEIVGFRHTWVNGARADEADQILEVLGEGDFGNQVKVQEARLWALIFCDLLESHGGTIVPLEGEMRFLKRGLNEDAIPAEAIHVLYALNQMPIMPPIEEWAVLDARPRRVHRRALDPHLAFRIGDIWFSIYEW